MVNSKGGFLVDEDGGNGREIDEETGRLEKLREKERIEKNAEPREPTWFRSFIFRYSTFLSVRSLDPSLNPKCRECSSMGVGPPSPRLSLFATPSVPTPVSSMTLSHRPSRFSRPSTRP